jgi:Txe/YoeB family toxin of Txe-Axe toxin-antitoxin module
LQNQKLLAVFPQENPGDFPLISSKALLCDSINSMPLPLSNRLEPMKDDRSGQWSIRIDG